jgi:hypothetical protein
LLYLLTYLLLDGLPASTRRLTKEGHDIMFGMNRIRANGSAPFGWRRRATRSSGYRGRRRLIVESLEDRTLLSTFTVNSLGDSGTGTGTSGDLRYCITQANGTSGANTINFSVTGTITLQSALPDLSNTTGLMDFEGPGAASLSVARSSATGTPNFAVLTVDAGANVQLVGLTVTGGHVVGNGGGINNSGTLAITNSAITSNIAVDPSSSYFGGGGIYNAGTLTVTNSTLSNNSAQGCYICSPVAGGIYNVGSLTLTGSTFSNNSGGFGGGIVNTGTLSVTGSSFADNVGAGISSFSGSVTIASSTITGNIYGGVGNGGTMTIENSTIAGNHADSLGNGCCGIGNNGAMNIIDSVIDNNSFNGPGGGLKNGPSPAATLTVTNSTIAGNSGGTLGGGIADFATLTLTNCTIASNNVPSSGSGGGLDVVSGTATLYNTIVALNTRGSGATADDISLVGGGTVSAASAYNVIGTGGSGGLVNGVNGNQVGVANPGLDPKGLQNNGGPTQTIALVSGSPAIDMGSNALAVDPTTGLALTTDQRGPGFARIVNGTVDIGAFEFGAGTMLVVTAQPPGSVTAGSSFGLTVTAENSSGTVDMAFNGTVTVALSANPGGSTLGGTLNMMAKSGVATFSDLTLNKAGMGYTLVLSATDLASGTTNPFNVTAATATQLVVTTQPPTGVVVGSQFGLVVSAEDRFFNVDPNFGGNVSVGIMNNPGGATLGGTLSVNAQSGVATFSNLTLNQPGIGYTLQLTASGLTSATTNAFNVQTTIATVAVGWGTQTASLQTAADGLRLLPAGRNTDMPWLGINKLPITISQAATLATGDVTVTSAIGVTYGPVNVSGSGTSYTITLAQPINKADRVTITIGNALIFTFTRRLDVLPGDFNDDGVVNSQDLVGVRNEMLHITPMTIFGDINGDGVVDIKDYNLVRKFIGTTLPPPT